MDSVKPMQRGPITERQKAGSAMRRDRTQSCCGLHPEGLLYQFSEFPVLQMFYRRDDHPCPEQYRKPMLIGLRTGPPQAQHIFRGNYGLASEEEIMASGNRA
jgi:hemerythrin